MHPLHRLALAVAVGLALLLSSCSGGHDSDSSEHGSSESERDDGDEESGSQFAKDDVYDKTRSGARLILSYDADADAFVGTVENTTSDVLSQVRVEVHLSNGVELGPTTRKTSHQAASPRSSSPPRAKNSNLGAPTQKLAGMSTDPAAKATKDRESTAAQNSKGTPVQASTAADGGLAPGVRFELTT